MLLLLNLDVKTSRMRLSRPNCSVFSVAVPVSFSGLRVDDFADVKGPRLVGAADGQQELAIRAADIDDARGAPVGLPAREGAGAAVAISAKPRFQLQRGVQIARGVHGQGVATLRQNYRAEDGLHALFLAIEMPTLTSCFGLREQEAQYAQGVSLLLGALRGEQLGGGREGAQQIRGCAIHLLG